MKHLTNIEPEIAKALNTWYDYENYMHFTKINPLMGLVGEVGELVDYMKKSAFKPNFTFDRLKFADELGDFWYYFRILTYQANGKISNFDKISKFGDDYYSGVTDCLAVMADEAATLLKSYTHNNSIRNDIVLSALNEIFLTIQFLLNKINMTIEELTELNYIKLNGDGNTRGKEWAGAK